MLSARIYLDDDMADPLLAKLLRREVHDVVLPSAIGLSGRNDPVHLAWAVSEKRIFLSGNHNDFRELHGLVLTAEGHHPGIFIVRKDNDRSRDLTVQGIVVAVGKICSSGIPLENELHVLNHWR